MNTMRITGDFFIVKKGSCFVTYDEKSKKIDELYAASDMSFKSAAGSTFNIKKGSYIVSYDKHCKKTGERYSS